MPNTGNTQQQINYGAAVNDGTGDPLRTAFVKTDDNFDAVWLAGPVGSNITIVNNTVQVNNTNGNLILMPNGIGVIQTNSKLLPSINNTYDLGSTTLKYRAGYFGAGGLVVDGNVTVTGNLTAGNISYTGNVFVGDLQGSVYADDSTIMVDAIDNELFAGRATISGNVSATYFVGNGSLLTGIVSSYGNANVVTLLAGFGSNTVSTTGNITANYFVGNGSQLTGITSYANANAIALGESGWIGNIIPSGNAIYSLGNATNQWNDLYVSNATIFMNNVPIGLSAGNVLTVNGNAVLQNNSNSTISTTGNITGGNLLTAGIISAGGNVTGDNVLTGGLINATGNCTAGNISVTGTGNVTGNLVGRVLTGTQSAITSLGTLTNINTNGNANVAQAVNSTTVVATGNISGGNILTAGNITGNTSGFAIGYRDIPQISFTANTTLAAGDAGKHYYSTLATTNTLTIANNTSVTWAVGTAITVINHGSGNINIAQATGVSLYLAGNSTAGNRTMTTYGMATLMNVAGNTWVINGTGVS